MVNRRNRFSENIPENPQRAKNINHKRATIDNPISGIQARQPCPGMIINNQLHMLTHILRLLNY